MQCDVVRQELAYYRELTEGEREAVQRHLATCPVCMAIWEQYQAQESLLSSFPDLVPSRDWAAQVRARTVDGQRHRARPGRRLAANASILALCLIVALGGTVGVSAQALPGSQLYPVKRAVEQARLSLTLGQENREAYRLELAATRREEAVAVAERDDTAPVQVAFQGTLTGVSANAWIIDGVEVKVEPDIAAAGTALIGQHVGVDAEAGGGIIAASAVFVQPTPTLHPSGGSAPNRAATDAPTQLPSSTPDSETAPPVNASEPIPTTADPVATANMTPTGSSEETDEATATPHATRRATVQTVYSSPTEQPTAYVAPTNAPIVPQPTSVPTVLNTDVPTAQPTPLITRVATARITRVVPPSAEEEPTPTEFPTWIATKSPTQLNVDPTVTPSIDATPTSWSKPLTPSAVPSPTSWTLTPIYMSPTPITPTATRRPQTNTPVASATLLPTVTPDATEPPTATPKPPTPTPKSTSVPTATPQASDASTATPKPPTATPVRAENQATPTPAPRITRTPVPTISPDYQRVPVEPPTPQATQGVPPAYPTN